MNEQYLYFLNYAAHYSIFCRKNWTVQEVKITVLGGKSLTLQADGHGNWTDKNGNPLPALNGCLDIDISATPFTNTLPIRRLMLEKNERKEISVVYIAIPSLTYQVAKQAYTCIEPQKRYLYEGILRSFKEELEVDLYGIILRYPNIFQRLV